MESGGTLDSISPMSHRLMSRSNVQPLGYDQVEGNGLSFSLYSSGFQPPLFGFTT